MSTCTCFIGMEGTCFHSNTNIGPADSWEDVCDRVDGWDVRDVKHAFHCLQVTSIYSYLRGSKRSATPDLPLLLRAEVPMLVEFFLIISRRLEAHSWSVFSVLLGASCCDGIGCNTISGIKSVTTLLKCFIGCAVSGHGIKGAMLQLKHFTPGQGWVSFNVIRTYSICLCRRRLIGPLSLCQLQSHSALIPL